MPDFGIPCSVCCVLDLVIWLTVNLKQEQVINICDLHGLISTTNRIIGDNFVRPRWRPIVVCWYDYLYNFVFNLVISCNGEHEWPKASNVNYYHHYMHPHTLLNAVKWKHLDWPCWRLAINILYPTLKTFEMPVILAVAADQVFPKCVNEYGHFLHLFIECTHYTSLFLIHFITTNNLWTGLDSLRAVILNAVGCQLSSAASSPCEEPTGTWRATALRLKKLTTNIKKRVINVVKVTQIQERSMRR